MNHSCSHTFLIFPGIWHGEGKIIFRNIKEEISFTVSWRPLFYDTASIVWQQRIDLLVSEDPVINILEIKKREAGFEIALTTQDFVANGEGFLEGEEIFWRYKGDFQGKESYVQEAKNRYRFFANYIYPDEETMIEGHIFESKKNI